jgi:hypothetical protein
VRHIDRLCVSRKKMFPSHLRADRALNSCLQVHACGFVQHLFCNQICGKGSLVGGGGAQFNMGKLTVICVGH